MWFSSLGARIRPYFWFCMIIEYVFVLTCRNRNNYLVEVLATGISLFWRWVLCQNPYLVFLCCPPHLLPPSLPSLPSYGAWAYSWFWALGSLPTGWGCCMECWRLSSLFLHESLLSSWYSQHSGLGLLCLPVLPLSLRSLILSGLHCSLDAL